MKFKNSPRNGQRRSRGRSALSRAVLSEALERRVLLSVSAQTLIGQILSTGSSYTYSESNGKIVTKTQLGPATSPGGQASFQIHTTGSNGNIINTYVGLTSAGLVEYETSQNFAGGGSRDDTYSPQLIVPATLTANTPVSASSTDSWSGVGSDGTPNSGSTGITDQYTLQSATPQQVTVPAGTFLAYIVTNAETIGTTPNSKTYYWAPNVGLIEMTNGTVTDVLTSYKLQDVLQFGSQPQNSAQGATIPQFTVDITNASGQIDTSNNSPVTLTLQGSGGTLSGTTVVNAVNGIATFQDLSIDAAGSYTLQATSSGAFGSVTSDSFDIISPLIWTGSGNGTSWSDPKNWSTDVAPQNGDSLIFPTGSPLSPNNDLAGLSINSIEIQGGGYTLGGNSISLTGGLTSDAGNNTYAINTNLVGSATIDDKTGDLTLNGNLSGGNLTLAGSGDFTFDVSDTYTGNTTLDPGVTINDDTLSAFGSGQVIIAAGASPVNIDGSATPAQIANAVIFQNGSTLNSDPKVTLTGPITVSGSDTIGAKNTTDTLTLSGNTISGTGTLTVAGAGVVGIEDNVAAGVLLQLNSGDVIISGDLQLANGIQVIVNGATAKFVGVSGTGSVDVKSGFLHSDDVADTTFTGSIVLEPGGELDLFDSSDGNGFGTGTIFVDGGVIVDAASADATIDNNISLAGNVTTIVSSGSLLGLVGMIDVTADSAVTLNGGMLGINSIQGSSQIDFFGSGQLAIADSIQAPTELANDGLDVIGGAIDSGLLVDSAGTTVELFSTANPAVSGNGNIEVSSGTLVTDETPNAGGIPGYTGNITLDPNGTLKYYDTKDGNGLGKGNLVLKGGTLQDSAAATTVQIGNPITLQGNVNVTISGPSAPLLSLVGPITVAAPSQVTLNGLLGINSIQGSFQVDFFGTGALGITGSIQAPTEFANDGADIVGGVIGSGVLLDSATTVLELNSSGSPAVSGNGDIEVSSGTLVTDENPNAGGLPGYTGNITLDPNGTLKYYDTKDGNGFGKGTLILKGGTLQDSAAATTVQIGNPITLQGNVNVTISGPSAPLLSLVGPITVAAPSQVTLNGLLGINSIQGSSQIDFFGTGALGVVGSIQAPTELANDGADIVGGVIGSGILVDSASTVLELNSSGSPAVSGNGNIEVSSGTLVSDETPNAGGIPGYSGSITLDPNGTIKYYDTQDGNGLGTGTLILNGGLLQNSTGGIAIMDNPVNVHGSATVNSQSRLKLYGALTLASGSSLAINGKLVVVNSLSGGGAITLNSGELAVAGSNPGFSGNISVGAGTIEVTQDDALGSGSLLANLQGQGVLQSVSSIGDPVIDNPLVIQGGTLVMQGQLTFPAGITVDSVAILRTQGTGSQIVSSGPLSGGGTIIVQSGTTFSSPGGSSGFSGGLQFQGGKVTPTVNVTDAGGIAHGSSFPAKTTLSAPGLGSPVASLEGVSPILTYYMGSTATGTGTTTAPSAPGTYTVVGSFAGSTDYTSATSAPLTFTISTNLSASFAVNDGSAQRSMVTSLTVTFNGPVTLAPGAITLKTSGGAAVPFQTSTSDNQTYILSFSGSQFIHGSLPDGRYVLTVHAAQVSDAFGDTMPADQSLNFLRLFGDYLGTGTVNNGDYLRFKQAYLSSSGGSKFNPAFDYDGNGTINNLDFLQFKKRYLTTI